MDFSFLQEVMDRLTSWKIPGNSISVCIDNKEVFNYQSGYADYENRITMGKDALFNIYSCSKVLTVTAALQLYEKGYFQLDDPLYDFIPEYKDMYVRGADDKIHKAKSAITLRHLFTMTSGLTYNSETSAFEKARQLTNGKMNTITVIKCLAEDPLSFEPGKKWMYSLSHDVLGAVVEVVSGKKFRDYVKENIFFPLDMKESCYHNESVQSRMAQQYLSAEFTQTDLANLRSGAGSLVMDGVINVGKKVVGHIFGCEYDSGGAGITTSVSDYSRFVSALANGGVGSSGERILSSRTIDLMRSDQLKGQPRMDYECPALRGYSYGLGVRTLVDVVRGGSFGSKGEFGWGGAAGANTLVDPRRKLSMFYAQHVLNPQDHHYQSAIRRALYASLDG